MHQLVENSINIENIVIQLYFIKEKKIFIKKNYL